jgi:type III restriction enzyme
MGIELKDFQTRTLDRLARYLSEARLFGDPQRAFERTAEEYNGVVPRYHPVTGLETIPYVCLRLPTGGGKTILGAYAIRVAAQNYIEKDFPLVLWLVPSNAIRTQTAKALKDATHAYRQALDEVFDGRVGVFEIDEIDRIRPQDIAQRVCIVVATIQTLRVTDKTGRDVYAHKEALEDHFTRMNVQLPDLDRIEDGPYAGKVKYSFANLMAIHRPMVIMDEAHNARTPLTFEVLNRISPSCIVELTATPDTDPRTGSNVLCRVSAAALKAESMIKLPIVLTEHKESWEQAVSDALRTRKRLAGLAEGESSYIRPLLLIQAESQDRPANVETVKRYLLENERIPESAIAVATGTQRELENVDLLASDCPIEVIITVQALKEGWDCSFAYVFCSTANIHNTTSVEQLLGRVLRMPYVTRRKAGDLNKAWAHVSSPNFSEAAKKLESSMVALGFDASEAEQAIERGKPSDGELPLFDEPIVVEVSAEPDLTQLSADERKHVSIRPIEGGGAALEISCPMSEPLKRRILSGVAASDRPNVEKTLNAAIVRAAKSVTGSERRDDFSVPRLCAHFDGALRLFDEDLILDAYSWDLLACKPDLDAFRYNPETRTFELDVDGNKIRTRFLGADQLNLGIMPVEWTEAELVRWLEKEVRQLDVTAERMSEWVRRAVRELLNARRFDLAELVRAKYLLRRELLGAISKCRDGAYRNGYQELLFGPGIALETCYTYSFTYNPKDYPANWLYTGGYAWQKHYYPKPGELKSEGEEFECAKALDAQDGVLYWVRNLAQKKDSSFWLPTATDRFYPDFVASLKNGRTLVVEYKGELYSDSADTMEKRSVGERWAEKSKGQGLFLIAERFIDGIGGVYEQIKAKIEGR